MKSLTLSFCPPEGKSLAIDKLSLSLSYKLDSNTEIAVDGNDSSATAVLRGYFETEKTIQQVRDLLKGSGISMVVLEQ